MQATGRRNGHKGTDSKRRKGGRIAWGNQEGFWQEVVGSWFGEQSLILSSELQPHFRQTSGRVSHTAS